MLTACITQHEAQAHKEGLGYVKYGEQGAKLPHKFAVYAIMTPSTGQQKFYIARTDEFEKNGLFLLLHLYVDLDQHR